GDVQPDGAVGAFEIRCRRARAEVHPAAQDGVPEVPVMALVRVAEECRGGYLAMHDAPRPDRGIADDATHESGVRADPEGAFEPHARLDLDATRENDRPFARVEHDAGLDRRRAERDPRGVALHDGAFRNRGGGAEPLESVVDE